jgi:hypothetical protein
MVVIRSCAVTTTLRMRLSMIDFQRLNLSSSESSVVRPRSRALAAGTKGFLTGHSLSDHSSALHRQSTSRFRVSQNRNRSKFPLRSLIRTVWRLLHSAHSLAICTSRLWRNGQVRYLPVRYRYPTQRTPSIRDLPLNSVS